MGGLPGLHYKHVAAFEKSSPKGNNPVLLSSVETLLLKRFAFKPGSRSIYLSYQGSSSINFVALLKNK
jgi:hypothetical protein